MSELFEITTIAAKDTFEVMLNNANDEPLLDTAGKQLSVTVFGPGSKAYAKANAARTQRMLDRMAKKGRVKLSAEEQTNENARFLSAVTVSFNGWAYQGESDETAVAAAYLDARIGFIADQVQSAVGDWANFTNGATKS